MIACPWIVCERTNRWTAALRIAMARDLDAGIHVSRVYQVRSLAEVTATLNGHPTAIVLVELRLANLEEALEWFASEACHRSEACFLALLDDSDLDRQQRQMMVEAVRAAGAADVAYSPRNLQHILLLARRHAELQAAAPVQPQSFLEWASSLLPWQEA